MRSSLRELLRASQRDRALIWPVSSRFARTILEERNSPSLPMTIYLSGYHLSLLVGSS